MALPTCQLTNRSSCRAARCAADTVSPVQCELFERTGVAGPQLSSTVRCPMFNWLLNLNPAAQLAIAGVGFAVGFFGRSQFTKHPKYGVAWSLWGLLAGIGFGIGLGLTFRLVRLLLQ